MERGQGTNKTGRLTDAEADYVARIAYADLEYFLIEAEQRWMNDERALAARAWNQCRAAAADIRGCGYEPASRHIRAGKMMKHLLEGCQR